MESHLPNNSWNIPQTHELLEIRLLASEGGFKSKQFSRNL